MPTDRMMMAIVSFTLSTNAFAMNQEGHEDWMTGFPPAVAMLADVPDARPLPSPRCPVSPEMLADNTYEQVPLPRHRCLGEKSNLHSPAYEASTR